MYCMFKMLPLSLYVHERERVKVNVFLVHKLNELLNILVQLFWLGLSLKCLCSCSFNSFRCCESSPAFMIICMSLFFLLFLLHSVWPLDWQVRRRTNILRQDCTASLVCSALRWCSCALWHPSSSIPPDSMHHVSRHVMHTRSRTCCLHGADGAIKPALALYLDDLSGPLTHGECQPFLKKRDLEMENF